MNKVFTVKEARQKADDPELLEYLDWLSNESKTFLQILGELEPLVEGKDMVFLTLKTLLQEVSQTQAKYASTFTAADSSLITKSMLYVAALIQVIETNPMYEDKRALKLQIEAQIHNAISNAGLQRRTS